jgi:hypothetical protein
MALTHSLGPTQDTLFLLAIAAGVITSAVPTIGVIDITGWKFSLVVFGGVWALRLLLAPYWIYKSDQDRLRSIAKPTQEALDALAELLSEGIHKILNAPLRNTADQIALVKFAEAWNERLFAHLDTNFSRSDALHVQRLGTVPPRQFDHALGAPPPVQRVLAQFALREDRIRDLIKRGAH